MSDYPHQVATIATALTNFDLRPGDRVLIMLPDGPDFAAAFAAKSPRCSPRTASRPWYRG